MAKEKLLVVFHHVSVALMVKFRKSPTEILLLPILMAHAYYKLNFTISTRGNLNILYLFSKLVTRG